MTMLKISKNLFVFFLSGGLVASAFCFWFGIKQIEANLADELNSFELESEMVTIEENSLVSTRNRIVVREINVIITGYSSSPEETDDNPLITASGEEVGKGIVANNLLPFGTEIRIPELYGDQIFVVTDRMHWRKGYYHVDIWFSSKEEAKNFGAKETYIEVLEG